MEQENRMRTAVHQMALQRREITITIIMRVVMGDIDAKVAGWDFFNKKPKISLSLRAGSVG